MSRRARALGFIGLAAALAVASASLAAGYRGEVEQGYGPSRQVVVVERELSAGRRIGAREAERLGSREMPERFVPPDALASPAEAAGAVPAARVPAGSYLLGSHLRAGRRDRPDRLGGGRSAIEVRVAAAGALARTGSSSRVDVVAAVEPAVTGRGRVRTLARGVELLGLRRTGPEGAAGSERWVAMLALDRGQSLRVIEAENFARELRLLPRAGRRR